MREYIESSECKYMPTALKIISLHLLYVEVSFNNAVYICDHAIHGGVMHKKYMAKNS